MIVRATVNNWHEQAMNSTLDDIPDTKVGTTESAGFVRRIGTAGAAALVLLTLWALTHRYRGFARDGELYAVQALAKVRPWLSADLYLQNTSQDRYTIFSDLYATFIRFLGLQTAEILLFSLCTATFVAAAFSLVKKLSTTDVAWASTVLLIVTVGEYGAYQVFSYSENYLTARSLSEALTVAALAGHFWNRRVLSVLLTTAALLVHPLMALPGALLLICLCLPTRLAAVLTVSGVMAILVFAIAAASVHVQSGVAAVMDPAWLEVVRERSQFLFLKYWNPVDWEIAVRPFVCLTFTAGALTHPRVRRLCFGAMLVGAAGLAVSAIAGTVGPVAILLQGQAWRWMWLTTFVSVILLIPTAKAVWRDPHCGPLCVILLLLGWTFSGVDGLACIDAAFLMWLVRASISEFTARNLRWAAVAIAIIIVGWTLATCWNLVWAPISESGRESLLAGRLRECFGLGVPSIMVASIFWYSMRRITATWAVWLVCASLAVAAAWILPGSMRQLDPVGSPAEIDSFTDWRREIPPTSNVLLVPTRMSAAFQWFTLERPGYLSIAQSAGVVFSRATALEVRRRSEVLLPLQKPDWKILTSIMELTARRPGSRVADDTAGKSRPLTRELLGNFCADRELGFVIAKETLGFDAVRHTHPGSFMGWNLYDCRKVLAADGEK